jgi:ABC-type polysaccharide/polyol phosphate transport system ATPase subunit
LTNAIEVHGLDKSFLIPSAKRDTVRESVFGLLRPRTFDELKVLRALSFEIRKGETFGIMGRNGCGKSTLLKILCGIYEPDAGRLVVNGTVTPILELGVGWNPELDAIDNILLIGMVMGLSLEESKTAVDEILAFADLERFAHLELKHYSSGMAARLAYSVAFRAVREILVLDEIFAVGDAGFRLRCEERYQQLSRAGHTVVLVSHASSLVATFCNRAVLIENGQILASGTGADVARAYDALLEGDRRPSVVEPS